MDDSGAENDFYIDVNDNGIVDSGDDLSIDFPGGPGGPGMGPMMGEKLGLIDDQKAKAKEVSISPA